MRILFAGLIMVSLIVGACSESKLDIGNDADAGDHGFVDAADPREDASNGAKDTSIPGVEDTDTAAEDTASGDAGTAVEDTASGDTGTGAEDTGAAAEDTGAGEPDGGDDVGDEDTGSGDNGEQTDPCEDRTLPSDWMRLTTGAESCRYGDAMSGSYGQWMHEADCRYFEGVYPWPWDEQQGSQRVMGIRPNLNEGRQYIALQFDSASLPASDAGQLDINIPQADPLINRRKLMTMSTCPGDFNQEAIDAEMGPGCYWETFVANFRWGGTDAIDEPNRCGLQPNTTYYINIIHTNSDMGTPMDELEPNPECLEGGCGFRMTPVGNVY